MKPPSPQRLSASVQTIKTQESPASSGYSKKSPLPISARSMPAVPRNSLNCRWRHKPAIHNFNNLLQGYITMNTTQQHYLSVDGAIFKAASLTGLIEALRADSWNPERDLATYCTLTAKAAKLQTGKKFRASPPEALATDLISAGLLTPISDAEVERIRNQPKHSTKD